MHTDGFGSPDQAWTGQRNLAYDDGMGEKLGGRLGKRLRIGLGVLGLAGVTESATGNPVLAQPQPQRAAAAAATPSAASPAQTVSSTPAASPAAILRITARHGEILYDKGGNGLETATPLPENVVLSRLDEVATKEGSLELASATGYSVRLGSGSHVALLGTSSLYLARGELSIIDRSGAAGASAASAPPFYIVTPCGRSLIRARDARLRVDGNRTVVSVYAGAVFLGSPNPVGAGVAAGQSAHCEKGGASSAPAPLLPAPEWSGGGEVLVIGDDGAPAPFRVLPVAAAARQRIELFLSDGETETPIQSVTRAASDPPLLLAKPEVGRYVARAHAIDSDGALGLASPPHPFLVARIAGLDREGRAHAEAGSLPRITAPKGSTWSVLLDGAPVSAARLTAGAHKLRLQIAGLAADVPLLLTGKPGAPEPPREAPPPRDFQGDSSAIWIGPTAEPEAPTAAAPPPSDVLSATPALPPRPTAAPLPRESPEPEDLLFGGIGEVPFDGVRSPWARSYVGTRFELVTSGALRVAAGGRFAMRNGFGIEATASLLRAAIANLPDGQEATGIGNLTAAVRTPRLARKHLAVQGLVGMVAPISTSFLDGSLEKEPRAASPAMGGSEFLPGARPPGGGWRVEPALLFGVRVRSFSLATLQGVSLRVAPDVSASYAGSLMLHVEILPSLRCVSFATWEVGYLGAAVAAAVLDRGGAVGGGVEALLAAGGRGSLRLALLGRAGVGEGGVALYGSGAVGAQVGYLFH